MPVECQLGSSLHRRPRLSKAGVPRIRSALYMAVVAATRQTRTSKPCTSACWLGAKPRWLALGAAMRKLVQLAFGVLKHQQPYQANWTPTP
ncbi:MAG: transposase [Candidatus Contendobacter sp.]|nr:transposase [Candidatus Contendobacter sp.]